MSKFTFICEDVPSPFGDEIITKKTFEFEASHLEGIVGEFENFLRGCGYQFNGTIDIVRIFTEQNESSEEDDLDLYTENLFGKK